MIRQLAALTLATVRDGIRSQIFVNLGVLAVFAVGGALVMEQVALGVHGRVLMDLGVAGTSFVNALLACFMVVRTMGGEEDRHTLLTILARPVGRTTVLLGKYLGVVMLVCMNATGAMALVGLTSTTVATLDAMDLVRSTVGLWMEGALVIAVTLMFSTFAGSTVAVVLGLGTYVCGLFAGELRIFADRNAGTAMETLVRGFYHAVPNLQQLDFHALNPSPAQAALSLLQALLYAAMVLCIGTIVSAKRDIR